MTPDERQLLSGLFDRIRGASSTTRDREAEAFISDAVRTQPYAPYLLAQTVIVQDQALRAANDKLQELERKVNDLQHAPQGGSEGGFLGGLGRSIFGSGQNEPPQGRPFGQQAGGFGQQGGGYASPPSGFGQNVAPQGGGPWAQAAPAGQGGGFLKGALGAAAGVAGGVLLANSISGLFHGNNSLGIASGLPGMGGGFGGGGETVINNYYENDGPSGADDGGYNDADYGADDNGGGSDGGYDV